MTSAEGKLQAVQAILGAPFGTYAALTQRERYVAGEFSRGVHPKTIAAEIDVSSKTFYRILESAAGKISAQEGETIGKEALVNFIWRELHKAANLN